VPAAHRQLLQRPNVEYIKSQIESGHPTRAKAALQHLCKLYRTGYRIPPDQLDGVEIAVVGVLCTRGSEEKVRCWALNSIARFGRAQFCLTAVTDALSRYSDEPQTAAAAIAALYKLSTDPASILSRFKLFHPQMVTLAALQHADARRLDVSNISVDVDSATPDRLKLALLVVGLDRAPPNLFHPRHSNAQIVKALGGHHDNVVAQYTVWAITENPNLGLGDLGVDMRSIEQQASNVRSWMFQLVAMSRENAETYWEWIELGTRDPECEARSGLAIGLRDTFFDGLEPLVLDWALNEPDAEVRQLIMDHVVRQSARCINYEEMAVQIYEKEHPGSSTRQRMSVNAWGTPLYSRFRRIDFDGQNDLFRGETHVTNINIQGGIQGGAVAVGGDATNSGKTSIHYAPKMIEAIQSELSKAARELHDLKTESPLMQKALEHVKAAQLEPSPEKINTALTTLKRIGDIAGTGTSLIALADAIGKMAGLC
jgi:hypothetical protein